MSRRQPWPLAAKATVGALVAVFVSLAVWSGSRQPTPSPATAGGMASTTGPTTSTSLASTTSTSTAAAPTTTTSSTTTTSTTTTTTGAAPRPTMPSTAAPPDGPANRPDPRLSPGVADPAVTQANIHSTMCVAGYSSSVRSVPQSEKDRVYAEYGITSHPTGAYEVDHLISLELGGSNDIGNLWPEPYSGPDNAHTKDTMENRLHAEVCAGQITLAQGQDEIVHWWLYE